MDTRTERQGLGLITCQSYALTPPGDIDLGSADFRPTPPRINHAHEPGLDSGYATEATTPDTSKHDPKNQDPVCLLSLRRRLFQRKVKLKQFDIVVPQNVKDRFRDVVKLIDRPLYEYLRKEGVHAGAVSITLRCLGEDEARASFWIVVLCEKEAAVRIRQWFNTKAVKSHCSPDDAISEVKLDVLVHERPPRRLSAVVYGTNAGHQNWHIPGLTLCGRLIRIGDPDHGHMATLGGLLKVSWGLDVAFCGITVNHVFQNMEDNRQRNEPETTFACEPPLLTDTMPSAKQLDEEGEDLYDDNLFELDLGSDRDSTTDCSDLMISDTTKHNLSWTRVGSACHGSVGDQCNYNGPCEEPPPMIASRGLDEGRARRLDWRLISIDDATKYWSNRLPTQEFNLDLKLGFDQGCEIGLERDVWISSGMSGLKSGRIAPVPVYLTLEHYLPLMEVYGLDVDDGRALQPGDCGSWIIDQASGEVYGHVVAIDVFDTVYVLPFGNILNDIKQSLNATDIALPTHEDLKSYWKTLPKEAEHPANALDNCPTLLASQTLSTDLDSGYASMDRSPTSPLSLEGFTSWFN